MISFFNNKNGGLKSVVLVILILCPFPYTSQAQTFSSEEVLLYDYMNNYFIQEIPIEVDGLPETIDGDFGIESIQFTIQHTRTSDLKIQLQAPDGTTVWISNRNGGLDGQNYINSTFSQYGPDGLINNAKAPFEGNYIPDGQISYFNNGSNPNGTWLLLIEDLKDGEEGILKSASISFSDMPAFVYKEKKCSMENPELCECAKESCELLPDLVIVPHFTETQFLEFAKDDSTYPGQLKIAVAIGNIGFGPMEVAPDSSVLGDCCGENLKEIDEEKRYDLFQKIYTKEDSTFSSRKVKSGSIYYESMPGHQHYHVDDWIEMRLVKVENGERKIICKGAKVSYCLFTTGVLYENDKSSFIDGENYGANMTNFALGNYHTCSLKKQGISVGGYDYYGMMYEGQYLQLPEGFKNGEYILEIEIDPEQKYVESDRSNNVFRMPIFISKQNSF